MDKNMENQMKAGEYRDLRDVNSVTILGCRGSSALPTDAPSLSLRWAGEWAEDSSYEAISYRSDSTVYGGGDGDMMLMVMVSGVCDAVN